VTRVDTVIIGAGLAGLSTALHLDSEYVVLEKDARAGGLSVTNEVDGYYFDVTGHWLHMRDPDIRRRFGSLVQMGEVVRQSKIFTHHRLISYPFQSNLKDLPDDCKLACLSGAVDAHIRRLQGTPEPESFDRFVLHHFGEGIAREFMFPYNQKLWGVEPAEISRAWCQRFVPVPDLKQILEGTFTDANERGGYNASFSYPLQGGIGAFTHAAAAQVDAMQLNSGVARIHAGEKWVETVAGQRWSYKNLVSTMPLKELADVIVDAPASVRDAGDRLRCTSVRYLDLGIDRQVLQGQHWLYIPDPQSVVYRMGCYSNAMPSMAPEGCSSLYVELANGMEYSDEQALAEALDIISSVGPTVTLENVAVNRSRKIEFAYVIYDWEYEAARSQVMDFVTAAGIQSTGRYGKWVYSSMEDALLDGQKAASRIAEVNG
jgi:protoporphyrinogen oxidase